MSARADVHVAACRVSACFTSSICARLCWEALRIQSLVQAQAVGGSSGSMSLPADIAQRAALLLNPSAQLSPLTRSLLVRLCSPWLSDGFPVSKPLLIFSSSSSFLFHWSFSGVSLDTLYPAGCTAGMASFFVFSSIIVQADMFKSVI